MHIRTATPADAAALAAVEAACFPPAEAATAAEIADRLTHYAGHFWLMEEDDGTVVSFVDGMVTDEPKLRDEMYENAALHNEDGAWQMIFGVNTLPAYRRRGVRRTGAGAGHRRRQSSGAEGLRPHLQGQAGPLLREVRLCERGGLPVHPRRRGVVRHAAIFLLKAAMPLSREGGYMGEGTRFPAEKVAPSPMRGVLSDAHVAGKDGSERFRRLPAPAGAFRSATAAQRRLLARRWRRNSARLLRRIRRKSYKTARRLNSRRACLFWRELSRPWGRRTGGRTCCQRPRRRWGRSSGRGPPPRPRCRRPCGACWPPARRSWPWRC